MLLDAMANSDRMDHYGQDIETFLGLDVKGRWLESSVHICRQLEDRREGGLGNHAQIFDTKLESTLTIQNKI
jgi:hypothetical protein